MALYAAPAEAQDNYPSRQVRVVVPFPAGGTTDMLARLFGQTLQVALGQPFIVENMGGAGGSVGAENIARAAPDGYALLFHNLTFSDDHCLAAVRRPRQARARQISRRSRSPPTCR